MTAFGGRTQSCWQIALASRDEHVQEGDVPVVRYAPPRGKVKVYRCELSRIQFRCGRGTRAAVLGNSRLCEGLLCFLQELYCKRSPQAGSMNSPMIALPKCIPETNNGVHMHNGIPTMQWWAIASHNGRGELVWPKRDTPMVARLGEGECCQTAKRDASSDVPGYLCSIQVIPSLTQPSFCTRAPQRVYPTERNLQNIGCQTSQASIADIYNTAASFRKVGYELRECRIEWLCSVTRTRIKKENGG